MSQIVPKPPQVADRDFRRSNRLHRRSHRRRRRIVRRVLVVAGIAIPTIGVISALSIIPALGAKTHLEHGKDSLSKAQTALLNGDLPTAGGDFADAESEFRAAAGEGNSPLMRIPALIPLIGRTPDAIRTIADVGVRLSSAGADITGAIAKLPGGIQALAPHDGQLPVDELTSLTPVFARARAEFESAAEEASGIATTLVPQQVVAAGDLLREKLDQSLPIVRGVDSLLLNLPAFAGMDGPKLYFLGAENPTELRGTGGLISSFAVLTIDHGALSVGPFEDIKKLPNIADPVWPSQELQNAYAGYESAGFWRSTNATPDGPTASRFIEDLWNKTQPTRIDGVMLVDIQALRYLLQATRPITLRGVPYALDERNVVPFVANRAYDLIKSDQERKTFLGSVGQAIFQQFLTQASGVSALKSLVNAAADGHIIVNSADPSVEAALAESGIAGAVRPGEPTDFFSAVVNNLGENKLDYYIHRDIRYDVTLLPDGRATAVATVTFDNTAPAGKPASYVLGPPEGKSLRAFGLVPGEAYQETRLYCGPGCDVRSIDANGKAPTVVPFTEQGLTVRSVTLPIMPQTTLAVRMSTTLDSAWTGSNALGTYRLSIRNQPTIVPTTATVVVHAPGGTSISYASNGVETQSTTATWQGTLSDTTTLQIRFQRGLAGRVWSSIHDFLSKPVIRLGG